MTSSPELSSPTSIYLSSLWPSTTPLPLTTLPPVSPSPTSIYLSSLWPSTTPLPLTTLPPVSPSPATSTPLSILTTSSALTPAPDSNQAGVRIAIIGSLILLFIFVSLVILGCLVGILFFKVSRKIKIQEQSKANSIRSRGRVISVSSSTYASVNERGRIRRHGRRQDSQQCSVIYNTRAAREASGVYYPAPSNLNPLLPVHIRSHVTNGTLSPNYELQDTGDYSAPVFSPAEKEEDLQMQLASLGIDEIPEDQLCIEEQIGRGQFGTVYKAQWTFTTNEMDGNAPQCISAHVAVKMIEENSSLDNRIKFLQEAVLLAQFNDPNIVALFGVVTESTNNQLMILCELMDEDIRANLINVKEKIQKGENTEQEMTELPALLLSYCRKIASSFVYLGLKGFVHRDLAARNILVSKEGDCKLSDFGLSRQLRDEDYYLSHGGMVPVKWTATEALMHRRYSTKSDVWSYGILLYEIWSLGGKPYPGMTNQEVVTIVPTGYRLPPPPGCPRAIYDLIIKCTHPQPESRPAFTNILTSLQRPDYQLLKWRAEDVVAGSEAARTLGAPLEEGEGLYTELQKTYKLIDSTD